MTWPSDNLPVLDAPGVNLDAPAHDAIHNQAITLLEALRNTLGLNVQGAHSTVNQRLIREAVAKVLSSSRGAHFEGRLVWDLDLNALLVSDGSNWSRIAGEPLWLTSTRLGIQTDNPRAVLHVSGADNPAGPDEAAREIARFSRLGLNDDCQISVLSHNNGEASLALGRLADRDACRLTYDNESGDRHLSVRVEGTEVFEARNSTSVVTVGFGGGSSNLTVNQFGALTAPGLEAGGSAGAPSRLGTGANKLTIFDNGTIAVPEVHNSTTGAGANMFVTPNGTFQRSTSARKYKTSIGRLSRDVAEELILAIKPVIYRSNPETNPTDNPERQWIGIIADDVARLGAFGRRLCSWQDDSRIDADDLDIPAEVEHVQYERLVAPLIATVQRQHERIGQLEQRLEALEAR